MKNLTKRRGPDLGRDPILPLVVRFSLPAILSYFISELYNMVDTFYVGNACGASAIGALGAVFPIQRLVIALSLLFAFGTANQLAYFQGAKDRKGAEASISAGLVLNLLIMIPYTLLVFFGRHWILPYLGAVEELLVPAEEYVAIIIWGSLFLCLSTTLARILLTMGHAGLAIWLNSVGAIVNIILDHILVRWYHMGVVGAAIATLISQIVCFLVTLFFYLHYLGREWPLRLHWNGAWLRRIFAVGLPSFIVEGEDAVVMAVLNLLLLRTAGTLGVNVMAMNTKVYMFLFVLILGFAYGMQTLVAYNHGAGKMDRVRQTVRQSLILTLVASALSMIAFRVWASGLLGLFVDDASLIEHCLPTFRLMILALPLLSFYYIAVMYEQAMGRAQLAIVLTILRQIGILLPLAAVAVLVFHVDLAGLFAMYPVTDVLAALIGLGLIMSQRKVWRGGGADSEARESF